MERVLTRPRTGSSILTNLVGITVLLVVAVLVIPWLGMNAGLTVQPELAWIDPDDTFVYLFVHHGVEAILALLLIAVLVVGFGWSRAEFGLQWGDVRTGLRITAAFGLCYLLLVIAVDLVPYLLSGSPPGLAYWPTTRNVVGTLAFQWLMVGVGEELLFRGLILGLLARPLGRRVRLGVGRAAFRVSIAGLVTAVLFAIAHTILFSRASFLEITLDPNWVQVGLALVLGVYYAALRERTGSLLGPILSHNLSDGLYLSATYMAVALTS